MAGSGNYSVFAGNCSDEVHCSIPGVLLIEFVTTTAVIGLLQGMTGISRSI